MASSVVLALRSALRSADTRKVSGVSDLRGDGVISNHVIGRGADVNRTLSPFVLCTDVGVYGMGCGWRTSPECCLAA